MRGAMLKHLTLTRTPSPQRAERSEPRLLPPNVVGPLRRPIHTVDESIVASRGGSPRPLIAPVDPLSERRPVSSATQNPGVLRQIILGCVAVVVTGGLGGAALTLLGPRANDSAPAASSSVPATQPPGPDKAAPTLPASPSSPGATQTATAPAHQTASSKTSVAAPLSGPTVPPARSSATIEPTSPSGLPAAATNAPLSPAAPPATIPVVAPHAATAAAGDGGIPHAAAAQDFTASRAPHASEPHRPAHLHAALRHLRLRVANEKLSTEPPIDSAHPPRERPARRPAPAATAAAATHPAGMAEAETSARAAKQTGAFDKLLTQLTGAPKTPDHSTDRTGDQVLTPPTAGAPDPFAARPPDQ